MSQVSGTKRQAPASDRSPTVLPYAELQAKLDFVLVRGNQC